MRAKTGLALIVGLGLLGQGGAQELAEALFQEADRALEAAREAGAPLLAPRAFERGQDNHASARRDLDRGRDEERVRARLDDAVAAFEEARRTAETSAAVLSPLMEVRADALAARADSFAADQWQAAERELAAAAQRLEAGDSRGAARRVEAAESLFRDAELTAIKAQLLSQARVLLLEAQRARVSRHAPLTLARAEAALEQADAALTADRYDIEHARHLAEQAAYGVRHAIALAEQVSRIAAERWSTEQIILHYEEAVTALAAAAGTSAQLDRGIDPVTAELTAELENLRERSARAERDLERSRARIVELEEEVRLLDSRLGGLTQERTTLVQRLEADARTRQQFEIVESLFARDEAQVSREGDTLVLRLVGLAFASASAEVEAAHRPLLERVRRAAEVFPRSRIVIEGHTDSVGDPQANVALSRRRAEAVRDYLSEELGVPAFRMTAAGYGDTRPIASNATPDGRERNRRIDVRIEPQGD